MSTIIYSMACKIIADPYNVYAKCCEVTDEPVRDDGPAVDGVFEVENHEQVPVSGTVVPHLYALGEDVGEVVGERVEFKLESGEEDAYNFEFNLEDALGEEMWTRIGNTDSGQAVVSIEADLDGLTAEEDELPDD